MAVVTITSDYGLRDPYAAAFKGLLLSEAPQLQVVDLSHSILPFQFSEAAYVLRHGYKYFPKGSIHILLVDADRDATKPPVVMLLDGHYFLSTDNGILPLIRPDLIPEKVVSIDFTYHYGLTDNWEIFAKTAAFLSGPGEIHVLGADYPQLKVLMRPRLTEIEDGNGILGHVVYIDNFGNLVTNISHTIFKNVGKNRSFFIELPRARSLDRILTHYAEARVEGDLGALFNQAGFLEIFVAKSGGTINGASKLLGIRVDESIKILFQ
jgi:S-adenosyl-L-methionine hydrolase (adenosine-forming)